MGLLLLLAASLVLVTTVLILPNLVLRVQARARDAEQRAHGRIGAALVEAIERTQSIPAATNWSSVAAPFAGLDQTELEQVYPAVPGDANTRRMLIFSPGLSGVTLPYGQSSAGLTGVLTNLITTNSRAVLVSNTKRHLPLPLTNGSVSSASFEAVWNWTYDPATKAPPSGWPSSWNGFGDQLHVTRFNFANLFHRVSLNNLMYGAGETAVPTVTVSSATALQLLRGTRLALAKPDGTLKQHHVVRRDVAFDFGTTSLGPPIIWFQMEEQSGTYATNSGSLGAVAAGTIMSGIGYAQNGPQPPDFPNFSEKNYGLDFNARAEYIPTAKGFLSGMKAFTLALWVNVDAVSSSRTGLAGQNDAIELGFISSSDVQLWTPGGGSVGYRWPYARSTWHHIAATGDGRYLRLYFDGREVASTAVSTSNYGTSSSPFCVGGAAVFDAPLSSAVFDGRMDEVIVYDRALSAAEVATLATGVLP